MRKTKAQEAIEIENHKLSIGRQKEYLISEYNREQKANNENKRIIVIMIGIALFYMFYMFYIGELTLSKLWYSKMEITLVNSIKNTVLLLLMTRTVILILAVKGEHLVQESFIDRYHKLNIEENGLDFEKYKSSKEVTNKISGFDGFVCFGAMIIGYPFLFLGSMLFLSYFGEGLYLASKIRLFEFLGFPIVNSIIFILLLNGFIQESLIGKFNLKSIINSLEITAIIILFMGIFQWL